MRTSTTSEGSWDPVMAATLSRLGAQAGIVGHGGRAGNGGRIGRIGRAGGSGGGGARGGGGGRAAQFGGGAVDRGGDRDGDHGAGDAGHHAAHGQDQDHRQRVQPDDPADDQRLEQVALHLVLTDEDGQDD